MASKLFSKKKEDPKRVKARNFIDECLGSADGTKKELSADKFVEIWNHYDKNGNRYLEEKELDSFLEDYIHSSLSNVQAEKAVNPEGLHRLKQELLTEFDYNKDGKISLRELSVLLSPEESFFMLFRLENGQEKGIDYMKIWKKYDRDLSGFIEVEELKVFLRDLIKSANRLKTVDDKRLDDYTLTIMDLFDLNKDGKLGFSELVRMLPANENFVQRIVDKVVNVKSLTQADVRNLLRNYDKDGSGTLEGSELLSMSKDIYEILHPGQAYNVDEVQELADSMLNGCDSDLNGRIDLKELGLIIGAVVNVATESAKKEAKQEDDY